MQQNEAGITPNKKGLLGRTTAKKEGQTGEKRDRGGEDLIPLTPINGFLGMGRGIVLGTKGYDVNNFMYFYKRI